MRKIRPNDDHDNKENEEGLDRGDDLNAVTREESLFLVVLSVHACRGYIARIMKYSLIIGHHRRKGAILVGFPR